MKEWLLHRGRPLLFSTALPPSATAATIESVKMLMESEEHTNKLWDNAKYFKKAMKALGFDIGISQTPITPVMIGDDAKTMEFSKALLD
ncbi:aminotransferase class I/II-fold pyridoxal phosphate-dependent enzyme, partial [Methanocalculus natronophilus]|uniref:aminotransferase class I/II-fold pyridoxal phosphate-dependent enzyme n=1 Tax=Methanocalculus natronophilus TaxID=1262400 RepID=UPI003CCC6C43